MSEGGPAFVDFKRHESLPTFRERLSMAATVATVWLIVGFIVWVGTVFAMLSIGFAALVIPVVYILGGIYMIIHTYLNPRRPGPSKDSQRMKN